MTFLPLSFDVELLFVGSPPALVVVAMDCDVVSGMEVKVDDVTVGVVVVGSVDLPVLRTLVVVCPTDGACVIVCVVEIVDDLSSKLISILE